MISNPSRLLDTAVPTLRVRIPNGLFTCGSANRSTASRKRSAMPLASAFKLYNDNYGHQAGDAILRKVAASLKDSLRAGDRVYRYGGEEFLVIAPVRSMSSKRLAMFGVCISMFTTDATAQSAKDIRGVDDLPGHWADASGEQLIITGLGKGAHTVMIELVNANHQTLDQKTVNFVVPMQAMPAGRV